MRYGGEERDGEGGLNALWWEERDGEGDSNSGTGGFLLCTLH